MSLKGVAKTSRLWGSHTLARGTSRKRWNSTAVEGDVSEQLRRLMRNIPQPVAIATTLYQDKYHGATLSSFTSLTLHPYPLVAFSLRLPSRLADAIRPADPLLSKETELERMKEGLPPDPLRLDRETSLNISLLDLQHESMAKELSRPGTDHSNVFSTLPFSKPESTVESRGVDNSDELPVILDAIGNLRCQVVSSIPLKDVVSDSDGIEFDDEVEGAGLYKNPPQHIADNVAPAEREVEKSTGDQVHGSELFICRVVSVESGSGQDPMLYYKHQYTTVKDA